MQTLLILLQIPILIFLIKSIGNSHHHELFRKYYFYLLTFKITAGIILGVIYISYYKFGDTIDYTSSLQALSTYSQQSFSGYLKFLVYGEIPEEVQRKILYATQPRALLFVKLLSPFYILTGSNGWILSIYLSLFSFYGFWKLSHVLLKYFSIRPLAILIAFFLFPSVVFWSSGLTKESLVMGLLCLWVAMLLEFINKKEIRISHVLLLLIFSYLLLMIKFYYFGLLIVFFIPYVLVTYYSSKLNFINNHSFKIYFLLVFFMVLFSSFLHPLLQVNKLSEMIYLNYSSTIKLSLNRNTFQFEGLSISPFSFIKHIPQALAYGLYGPFLWHCKKIIALISGIENTVLIVLTIPFLFNNLTRESLSKINLFGIATVLYIITLAVFMAFSSPNWGTLVRYKIGFLPFLLVLLLNGSAFIQFFEKKLNLLKK